MGRAFVAASSQSLDVDSAVVTGYPFTMACFFRSDDATIRQILMFVGDKDVTNSHHTLEARGDVASDVLRYRANTSGGLSEASTTTGYTTGTLHHAACVGTSATSRAVFIDGGSKGTSVTSRTPSGLDRTSIGRAGDSTPSDFMSGSIYFPAVWSVALSDADVASLAAGADPRTIQPASLVAFWPLGGADPEPDEIGSADLTVTGATFTADPWIQLFMTQEVTVAENVAVTIVTGGPSISVNDTVSVAEFTAISLALRPAALDNVSVVDDTAVMITVYVSGVDTVTVTESRDVQLLPILLSVFDAVSIAENVTLFLGIAPIRIQDISESVTVLDSPTVILGQLIVAVSDTVTATEVVGALFGQLIVSVNETVTVTDAPTIVFLQSLAIAVFDAVIIAESVIGAMVILATTLPPVRGGRWDASAGAAWPSVRGGRWAEIR